MVAHFLYAGIVPHVVAVLAYLAGLIVAIILLVRTKARAATLALVGFALLMLITLGQIVLSCCCSVLDLAAIVCLIVAIWQAVTGAGKQDAVEDVVYLDDMPAETAKPDETPEGSPFATQKLSDSDDEWEEGEIVEDVP
jgi:hypothetical protein